MPFQGYVSELQLVSRLLSNCKRIVLEDKDGVSIFAIISSIVWRISNIVSQAKVVEHQINGILISLKNKKELIEKEYQLPINTIYQDSLTSNLLTFLILSLMVSHKDMMVIGVGHSMLDI